MRTMFSLKEPKPEFSADSLIFLFLVSLVALFLELMLIRWISAELRFFAYLQSSVLMVCLLGLGMGCFSANRPWGLSRLLPSLAILVAIVSFLPLRQYMTNMTNGLATLGNFHIWVPGSYENFSGFARGVQFFVIAVHTAGILFLVMITFIPLGQAIGRCLDAGENTVKSYSVNIIGSFAGIALFTVLSSQSIGPFIWTVAFVLLFLPIAWRATNRWLAVLGSVIILVMSAWGQHNQPRDNLTWSPYQKLQSSAYTETDKISGSAYSYHLIFVNNVFYQIVLDLRTKIVKRHPGIFDQAAVGLSHYDLPMLFKPNAKRVLIVGAGSGNDVAGALRHGAEQITAVEIDPVIIDMGRSYHRERPYQDQRVKIVNDDARAYFASAKESFDLIIFSFLDSHTAGPMTNARLDHYVYTQESLEMAKSLLSPTGVMTLTFEADKPYIADRLNFALGQVFGEAPLAFRLPSSREAPGGVFFVTGNQTQISKVLDANDRLAGYVEQLRQRFVLKFPGKAKPTTDDWPFLYLENPTIPPLFTLLAVIMVFIFLMCGRWTGILPHLWGWGASEWHFFFLGAAFMLLEVSMISKSAVAFGSTWVVNAIIISGIFAMILTANLIYAYYKRLPIKAAYAALLLTCAGLYFFDLSGIVHLQMTARIIAVACLTTLPMLFSGIVFMHSFDHATNKSRVLGANLLGALTGGLAQVLSFALGMQFLMLLVGTFYLVAIGLTFLPKTRGKVGTQ